MLSNIHIQVIIIDHLFKTVRNGIIIIIGLLIQNALAIFDMAR